MTRRDGSLIAAIIVLTAGVIAIGLAAHHEPGCPPGQHLTYMTPSDPGYSPGLQECK